MSVTRAMALGAALLALGVYVLRLDHVAGMYVDDAWYVVLAQAIASGRGYHLVSAPTAALAAILPASPPGFALVLAPVVLLTAAFPANVLALKAVSVLAMFGVGVVAVGYFRARGRELPAAIGLALAVVLTPAFVWLATSTVMSEPLFTLAQLGAVVLVMRRRDVAGGAAAAAAALIRSAGLPVILAALLWYAGRREWRRAVRFLATAIVFLLPWTVYARIYASPLELRLQHGGAHVFTYAEQFWMRRAGEVGSGQVTVAELPGRVGGALVDIFGRDVGAIVLPELYRSPIESGEETLSVGGRRSDLSVGSMGNVTATMVFSALLSVVALVGFVWSWRRGASVGEYLVPLALVPVALFPHWAYRLVLPLTPFLYDYLVSGVQAMTTAWPRVVRIGLVAVLTLHGLDHAQYLLRRSDASWLRDARDVDQVIDWMQREVTGPGDVASTNPALIYLRTGRHGVAIDNARARWQDWRTLGIRYVVALDRAELPDPALGYRVRFKPPASGLWVIEIE